MDSGIFTLLLTDGTQGLERCVNRKVIIIFCPIVYFIEPWRYRDLRQDILVDGKYINGTFPWRKYSVSKILVKINSDENLQSVFFSYRQRAHGMGTDT